MVQNLIGCTGEALFFVVGLSSLFAPPRQLEMQITIDMPLYLSPFPSSRAHAVRCISPTELDIYSLMVGAFIFLFD